MILEKTTQKKEAEKMLISTLISRALDNISLTELLIVIIVYGAVFISEYSGLAWLVFVIYFIILVIGVNPKSLQIG